MKSARNASCIICIALLLSAALALAAESEDALNAKRVEALLLSLPGRVQTSGIEVKGDSLVVRGLTSSLHMQEGKTSVRTVLRIGEIACTGVDFKAMDTPGVRRLAASIRITGYAAKVDRLSPERKEPASSFSEKILMHSVVIRGLHGDAAELRKALSDMQSPTRLLRSLVSFKVDSMDMEDASACLEGDGFRPLLTDVSGVTAQDFSLLHSGPVKMEGFALEVDGRKALEIDSAGHDSLRFTELVAPLLSLDLTKSKSSIESDALLILLDNLQELSLSMEGLHISGVRTLNPEWGDNALRRIRGTLKASLSEVQLDGSVEDLKLDPRLYTSFGAQGKALAELYGKTLYFSGGVQAAAVTRFSGGGITLHELNAVEPNLGKVALSLKLAYSPGILALFARPDDLRVSVQEAEVQLEDKGIGDLLFALGLKEKQQVPDAGRISTARSSAAQNIRKAAADKGGKYAEAAEALAELCARSGAVSLRLRPDTPIPLEHIKNFRPLKDLDVHYSPPSKRDAAQQ